MSDLIPIFFFAGVFFLGFLFIAFMRYMNYRELLVLTENNLITPRTQQQHKKGILNWGIILTAIGLALTVTMLPILIHLYSSSARDLDPRDLIAVAIALVPLFCGLALILYHILTRQEEPL